MAETAKVVPFYKKRGETLAQALARLREEHKELKRAKLSYAGRLDPMAEGLLLILVGEENARRAEYLDLPKTYQVNVLFGFSTDTHDLLGKIEEIATARVKPLELIKAVAGLPGRHDQLYPVFSSKPVSGKALFEWAREERLDEIDVPTHPIEIYKADLLKTATITGDALGEYIDESLALVNGDFRQDEVRACWEYNLRGTYLNTYDIAELVIECSSGTYMRMVARDLGKKLGIPALALGIKRTRIGKYAI